jgi:hypothetical protein
VARWSATSTTRCPPREVDQWGDLGAGLRYNRAGRRRALLMLLALAALTLVATGLVVLLT